MSRSRAPGKPQQGMSTAAVVSLLLAVSVVAFGLVALLMNVAARKQEAQNPFFRVVEIEVVLGLTPALRPHLQFERALSEDEKEALLAEARGKGLTHTILSSLFSAINMRQRLNFSDFSFDEIEVEIGVLPSISLKFLRNGYESHSLAALPAPADTDVADG